MKNYKWLLILLLIISCRAQENDTILPGKIKLVEVEKECICRTPHIKIDTSTTLIREKNREIHLLRVEIDDLKQKMDRIKKLQALDSVLKTKTP